MSKIAIRDEAGFNQIFAPVGSTPLRSRRRADWFVEQARRTSARRVLEIGCGTGETAAHIAAHSTAEVIAVDISPAFIETARARHQAPNLRFERCDLLEDDSRPLGQFGLVCGNGILHHLVTRLDAVLRALRQATTPTGGLAFIEPNLLNPFCAFIFGTSIGRRWAHLDPDEMAFTAGQLRRALATAGWHGIDVATRDFLLPGLPHAVVPAVLAVEPALQATALTRWLAQSHFITARA